MERGLVHQIDADIRKKRRIYYEITEDGRTELLQWITTPPILTRFRVELLMKLRFGAIADVDTMKANIEHYRKLNIAEISECLDLIESLRENRENLTDEIRAITALYLLRFKQAMNTWCVESTEILDRWVAKHPMSE